MLTYISRDGKTFEERFAEALISIPLYTDEWTNFNGSDPGITILETLSGFETLQQDEIDVIPFKVRQNLLKMVGFQIRKGRNARLLLSASNVKEPVLLPVNHKFRIGDIVFETNRPTEIRDFRITGIYGLKSDEDSEFTDFNFLLDRETRVPAMIFGEKPAADDKLYIITNDLPAPSAETTFYFTLQERYNRNPMDPHMENTFAQIRWECLTETGWQKMDVRDNTHAFLMSGEVKLWMPSSPAAVCTETPTHGYCIRVVLESAEYDVRPKVTYVDSFLFEVWQKDTISECHSISKTGDVELRSEMAEEAYIDVFCREGKGEPYRKYEFNPDPNAQGRFYGEEHPEFAVFKYIFDKKAHGYGPERSRDCIRIVVYTEQVMRQYAIGTVLGYDEQAMDLPFRNIVAHSFCLIARRMTDDGYIYDFVRPEKSEDGALHYHLLENDGRIIIEDAGEFIGADLFIASVSLSGGENGNIRAGNFLSSDNDDTGIVYYNPGAGTGGAYREKIEDVRQRFLADISMPYTAVTEEDYEKIVRNTPGLCVHKAKAIMDDARNLVTIAVKPGTDEAFPSLPEIYRRIINKRLEDRRLLTTRVELIPPIYVAVNVTGTVYVKIHYDNSLEDITRVISDKINYLTSDRNFGDRLKFDEVFHAIEFLECVEYVYDLSLRPQSVIHARMIDADIQPDPNCLLYPGQIQIETVTFES